MSQKYTEVEWQDPAGGNPGTLINKARLDQMQTAHHYADGFEEVDAVPTADPGVSYHKIVYCTADSTFYRWDGTEWTKDIDDETKALLQQEIARATAAEGVLRQDIADEETRATARENALEDDIDAEETAREQADTALGNRITAETTARETADTALGNRITAEETRARQAEQANAGAIASHIADTQNPHEVTKAQVGLGNCNNTSDADKPISTATQTALDTKLTQRFTTAVGREYVYAYTCTQQTSIEASKGMETLTIPIRDSEGAMHAQVPASPQATHVINYGWANTELDKKADKATTYTKTEIDTVMATKADKATTLAGYGITDAYTKTEADTLLGAKANDNAVVHLAGAETIEGVKTFTSSGFTHIDIKSTRTTGNIGGIYIKDGSGTNTAEIFGQASGNIVLHPLINNSAVQILNQRAYVAGNTEDVATIGTLDAYTPMVRTTGNQTIGGIKTFFSIDPLCIKMNNVSWAGPTDTFYLDRLVYNIDKDDRKISEIYSTHDASGQNNTQIVTNAYIDDGNGNYTVPKRAYLNVKVRSTDGKAALIFHAPSGTETTIIDWTA